MNLLIEVPMSNVKTRGIDDIIGAWNDQLDEAGSISQEEINAIVARHQKERKASKISSVIYMTLIAIFAIHTIPFADHWITLVCQILLIFSIFYFMIRYARFQDKLKNQDCSPTISDFLNLRRQIAVEGHSYLKSGRYIIYPIILGFNIGHILADGTGLDGKWFVANILFSLTLSGGTINYLEKAIREFRDKVQALS